MPRFVAACAMLALLLLPPGAAGAQRESKTAPFPVTLVDDLGAHVRITHQPRHILSLDPRDTETLFALGLERRLVGDGSKSYEGAAGIHRAFRYPSEWPSPWGRDYPVKAPTLPHVEGGCCGTPWNLETIESLKPDLILSLNSDLTSIARMRNLGLKVLVLDPANFRGIVHDITLVGRATGNEAQAARVEAVMQQNLNGVRRAVARSRSRPTAYYEIDASNPTQPYTAGPGTFIDEAIRLAGGRNVAQTVSFPGCPGTGCYIQFSLEALVRRNPQVILLGDAAYGTTPADVRKRAGWQSIAAVRSGKIYPFDDELISRAGPRIVVGIRKIAYRLHPAAFR